jgi:N-acetylglucosaminyldiphosphoundecaprenol N-acetyl-beta-D-mannosaminyltransferase
VDGVIREFNKSGAAFLFVGLGSPKQENFVWEHRAKITAVQLCVGAAFDFIAETRRRAPIWMQRSGLEWLYRMISEPTRLGQRYIVGNMIFLVLLLAKVMGVQRPFSGDLSGHPDGFVPKRSNDPNRT